ncbi:zinc-dependent metalloprotease [Shewanella chilikensis]|uniref:zinc-dependent metalloprotease n=1 Tax=Shewanella chilikensis TaxID=558541 RepID=UPI00399A7801
MKPQSWTLLLALIAVPGLAQAAQEREAADVISESTQAEGFINLFYDAKAGQLYLEPSKLNQPMLLLSSLPHGAGSNDIGLDRGQLGYTRMVQFERQGPYILLKQLNTRFRADTDDQAEQRAVHEAFAESVLWRGKLLPGKRLLVPVNDLMLQDLHGISQQLAARGQGHYRLDTSRSVVLPASVKSFERNSDVDVQLTFASDKAGARVAEVTPDGQALSLRLRYSFIALPEPGYQARLYHPMSGYLSDEYKDYATAIDQDINQRFLLRHRLQKVNPGPDPSEVVEPITYYLDPGVPEPIRGALLEGGRWWEQAFNEAGFINGFKLELLPEGADPQDVRYNVIQWVHRASRGWSYGAAVTDPRSGEIIKGQVTLGSLRVRQDHLIARGLTAGWEDRQAADEAAMALSLARIRQLSAHEIGHTLGLDHNFAASTNNNASVMDYPHPYVRLDGKRVDISQPYAEGLGAWDKFAIKYGYGDFGDEAQTQAALKSLLKEVQQQGLRYIGEGDSRATSAAHAYASLWDRGEDPVKELARMQLVRRQALETFSAKALLSEQPLGELSDALVPIYLLNRYQISAAAKFVGGIDYNYLADAGSGNWHFIAPELQKRALETVLATLDPRELYLPTELLEQLVPKAGNYYRSRESFDSSLGVAVDQLAMAEVLSRHTVSTLLNPERLNRVDQAFARDTEQLSVEDLLDRLLAKTLLKSLPSGDQTSIAMRVNAVVLDGMLQSLESDASAPEVKAMLRMKLDYLLKQLPRKEKRSSGYKAAHYGQLQTVLEQALKQAGVRVISKPAKMPPGSPI